jgi:hypothetical protein
MRPIFGVGNREYNGGCRFVRSEHFGRRDINNYYINRTNNVTIIKNTTVINNIHTDKIRNVSYNSGPNRIEVEKHTGKAIHSIAIKENDKPGQNINDKQLEIYRPQINKNDNVPFKPVPPQLIKMEDIKTRKQKITEGKNINASQTDKQRLQPSIQKIRNQPVNQQKQDVQQNKKQSLPPQKIDKPIRQQPIKQQPSLPQKNIPIPPSPEQSKTPIRKVQPSRNDEKMMQPRERPIPHADPYQEQEERRGPL